MKNKYTSEMEAILKDYPPNLRTLVSAHHVLQHLLTESEQSDLKILLLSLDNNLQTRGNAPAEAAKALEKHWPAD